jgi:hypothetical protein
MARIDRIAVGADIAAIAAPIVRPFPLVAVDAKRLQRAKAEGVPIALMRRVVVGDGRRRHPVRPHAGGAKRMGLKLVALALLPSEQSVPLAPI